MALIVALLVGLLVPASATAVPPVTPQASELSSAGLSTTVHRAVQTASGPVWLATKNPLGTRQESSALMDLLERQIERQQRGDSIRLTTWSFYSQRIADALIAATKRGVTVRVVVDQKKWKLGAVRSLRRALGTSTNGGSYIAAPYPQSTHTKVATFSRDETVLISSGNVSNPRQWNHSVVIQSLDLYRQTSAWVDRLGSGQGMRYYQVSTPQVTLHFYPGTVDPVLDAIRGADGEPIHVQMSIWKGSRGSRVAAELIEAYRDGSSVTVNTGGPWSEPVRAVEAAGIDIVNTRRATAGRAYVHDKLLVVGDDVYTGSTNWGAFPKRFSEVVAHIESVELADLMRAYVTRTRVQAGVLPSRTPQSVDVAPGSESALVTMSTTGDYDVNQLVEFQLRAVSRTGQSTAGNVVPVKRRVDGTVDASATLRATVRPLVGGQPTEIEVVPRGRSGRIGPVTTVTVTPHYATPGAPTALTVDPLRPRRARVSFVPAAATTPPDIRRIFEVRWSPDGGRKWASRQVSTTRLRILGLSPGVRVPVQVREITASAEPSEYSGSTWVRPTRRPHAPQDVSLRLKRTSIAVVRWHEPSYTGRSPVRAWLVRYRVDDGRWLSTRLPGDSRQRYRLTRLPAAGEVDVRVAAVNGQGRSAFSGIVSLDLAG